MHIELFSPCFRSCDYLKQVYIKNLYQYVKLILVCFTMYMYTLISLPLVYCFIGASCKKCLYFRCMQPLDYTYHSVFLNVQNIDDLVHNMIILIKAICIIYIYYNRDHCLCSVFICFYSSSGIQPRLWPRERNNLNTTLARNELINQYNYTRKSI